MPKAISEAIATPLVVAAPARPPTTFYIYDTKNLSYYEAVIQGGTYDSFDTGSNSLEAAIQSAVDATLAAALAKNTVSTNHIQGQPGHIPAPNATAITVGYDKVLRCFTFEPTITGTIEATNTIEIRCFHLKTKSAAPAGVSKNGAVSDVHEILGMKTIFDAANILH